MQQPNWTSVAESLNELGFATIKGVLAPVHCKDFIDGYNSAGYRQTIAMERYRFGRGEYKYFNYPLPETLQRLRETLYPPLAKLANDWMTKLAMPNHYPKDHAMFLRHCERHHQLRPTPLILKYERGGFNTLHQDLYGEVFFPLQVVIMLNKPGVDYEGGALVLTDQLPRAQSRVHVLQPGQGDAVIITTNFKPVKGGRGYYRSRVKHGVSTVHSGTRFALGIIFHDAL